MMTNFEKRTGMQIVELLCQGISKKDIKEKLSLSEYQYKNSLSKIRAAARLPWEAKTYVAAKEDIRANLDKYERYTEAKNKLREEYIDSVKEFDF